MNIVSFVLFFGFHESNNKYDSNAFAHTNTTAVVPILYLTCMVVLSSLFALTVGQRSYTFIFHSLFFVRFVCRFRYKSQAWLDYFYTCCFNWNDSFLLSQYFDDDAQCYFAFVLFHSMRTLICCTNSLSAQIACKRIPQAACCLYCNEIQSITHQSNQPFV